MKYFKMILFILLFIVLAILDGFQMAKMQGEVNQYKNQLQKIEAKNKRLTDENEALIAELDSIYQINLLK